MKYQSRIKIEKFKSPTSVQPDGFGSWRVINQGDVPVLINDSLELAPGETFGTHLQPYVVYSDNIDITFVGEGSRLAVVIKEYNINI